MEQDLLDDNNFDNKKRTLPDNLAKSIRVMLEKFEAHTTNNPAISNNSNNNKEIELDLLTEEQQSNETTTSEDNKRSIDELLDEEIAKSGNTDKT
jgi:hypothetical protein